MRLDRARALPVVALGCDGPWGRSDPAPTPRTGQDLVADLRALLTAARVPGPFVIAGHSNGGLFAQLYASKHPDEIAGLVLLDAVHKNYHGGASHS